MAKLPLENVPLAKQWAIKRQPPVKELSTSLLCLGVMMGLIIADVMTGFQWVLLQSLAFITLMMMQPKQRMVVAIFIIGLSLGIISTLCERKIFNQQLLDRPVSTKLTGTIYHSETQAGSRVRLWLTDIESNLAITWQDKAKIRIIMDDSAPNIIEAGARYSGRVQLFPLNSALFPDWPNYGRKSWREGLVATGYSISGKIEEATEQHPSHIMRIRNYIHGKIYEELTPHAATIASALLIGRKNYEHQIVFDHFRQAGLAHLLAISGLHMALFCVSLYGVLRLVMSVFVRFSQSWPAHKIAAVIAILAGFFYLLLAGHPISAIRAFFMTAMMFSAVLLDRRTVTLRHLNYITLLILIVMPSALHQPAFQLSFAATYGIVMFHDVMSQKRILAHQPVLRQFYYMVATSSIAILATLLITSYHFGVVSVWGVVANIVAIPYTAIVVMPVGIVFLLSLIGGVEWLIAPLFEVALQALLQFAGHIADWPYAELFIKMPPAYYLPLSVFLAFGAYYARREKRIFIIIAVSIMALHWYEKPRPIAAFHRTAKSIHMAYHDEGVLYHTRSLSDFWRQSYQKLFGKIEKTNKIQCRSRCQFTLNVTDKLIVETAPQLDMNCPEGQGVMVTLSPQICNDYRSHQLTKPHDVTLLYQGEFYRLDHSNRTYQSP